ncbi:Uncharacterized protein APZ42_030360, partial [Daphnia magna]
MGEKAITKSRKNVSPFKNWSKVAPQIICATSASWAVLCTGLVRGWSSSAIAQLRERKNGTLYLEKEEAAWISERMLFPKGSGSLGLFYIDFYVLWYRNCLRNWSGCRVANNVFRHWIPANCFGCSNAINAGDTVLAYFSQSGTSGQGCTSAPPWQRISNNANSQLPKPSYAKILTNGHLMKPLIISMALMLFQQLSGINAIVFYSASVFQDAGCSLNNFLSSIIIAVVAMVFTMISVLLVDRFGRRKLLMISGVCMAVSLTGLGVFVYLKTASEDLSVVDETTLAEPSVLSELGWLPLLFLISFIIAYSMGFCTVPQLIMGELFPLEYRNRLGTISASFSLGCTFIVVRTFPEMAAIMGLGGVYGLYAACCLI